MRSLTLSLLALSIMFAAGCGSSNGSGPAVITGPELSLSEAQELVINQFYLKELNNGGKSVFFSVYLKDTISGDYIVCAGPDQGLDTASEAGVYYGSMAVPMVEVTNAVEHNPIGFNVVIVADQETPCPALPDESKIVKTSADVDFKALLDSPIEIGTNDAFVTLIARENANVDVKEIPAAEAGELAVGEVYFEEEPSGTDIPNYYLVLYLSDGSDYRIINYDDMPEMREPKIIYSWLGLTFTDIDTAMQKKKAWVVLNRLDASGPTEIGKIEAAYIKDLYGHNFNFTNGKGYIKFRKIN